MDLEPRLHHEQLRCAEPVEQIMDFNEYFTMKIMIVIKWAWYV